MGKPKKQTSPRKTGLRRSHLVLDLARKVNGKSPVKAATTTKQSGRALRAEKVAKADKTAKTATDKKTKSAK